MLDRLYEYFIDYGTATEERRHLSTLNRACLQPIKDKLTETEYFDLTTGSGIIPVRLTVLPFSGVPDCGVPTNREIRQLFDGKVPLPVILDGKGTFPRTFRIRSCTSDVSAAKLSAPVWPPVLDVKRGQSSIFPAPACILLTFNITAIFVLTQLPYTMFRT